MNICETTKIENCIASLWLQGKSCEQIGKILNIKFTFKNQATGKDIPISDISRTMQNGLMSWIDLTKTFTDTLV